MTQGRDHTKRNGAVPTKYQESVTSCQQRDKTLNQRLDAFGHLIDVLSPRIDRDRRQI